MPDDAHKPAKGLDIIETLKAEIAEAVEMMRPHFPGDSEDSLCHRAESLRAQRYRDGHWPDFAEIARKEAEAAAEAACNVLCDPGDGENEDSNVTAVYLDRAENTALGVNANQDT
jgi:hypothetical protein